MRKELAGGSTITSAVGYTFDYNTLDNNKNPTDGLLIDWKQDFAGVGGDVTYLKSAIDAKYYTPLVADIVAFVHLQGGLMTQVGNNQIRMLDQFQEGPNLVRGFAPNGIGPRDINPYGTQDALGGTQYWGASLEFQTPFWFLPKELGMKGAVYADAGWLGDYKGPTDWATTGEVNLPGCIPPTNNGIGFSRRTRDLFGIAICLSERRAHVGRRGPDLAVAVRAAPLRLRDTAHQGQIRHRAGVQVRRRHHLLIACRHSRQNGSWTKSGPGTRIARVRLRIAKDRQRPQSRPGWANPPDLGVRKGGGVWRGR